MANRDYEWSGMNTMGPHRIAMIDDDENVMVVNSEGDDGKVVFSMLTTDGNGDEGLKNISLTERQVGELFDWIRHKKGRF